MADTYVAVGEIRYASPEAEGKRDVEVFQPGDVVSGLPKADMEQLVEVGSVKTRRELEKRDAPAGESDLEKQLRKEVEDRDAEITALKAKLAEAEKKQNAPVSGGQSGTPTASSSTKK